MAPAGQDKAATVSSVDGSTWYRLTNKFAGADSLDIVNGAVGVAAPGTDAGQSWQFLQQSDGTYRMRTQGAGPNNYLDAQGTTPQLAAQSNSASQLWTLVPLKQDGAFQISNQAAGGLLLQADANDVLSLSVLTVKPQTKWAVKAVGPITDAAFLPSGSIINSSPANPSSPTSAAAANGASPSASANSPSSPSLSPSSSSPSNRDASGSLTANSDSPLETGSTSPSGTATGTETLPEPTATRAFASATVVIGPGYTSTIVPTSTSTSTSDSDIPNVDNGTSKHAPTGRIPAGAIAGTVIGVVILLALIAGFLYWQINRKRNRKEEGPQPMGESVRLSDLPKKPPSRTDTGFSVSDDGVAPPPPFSPEKPPLSPTVTPAAEAQTLAVDVEARAVGVEIGGGTRQTNYGLPDDANELSGSHVRAVELDSAPRYG